MRGCIRPRFPQLLHNPGSVGISCHVTTQNLSPVVGRNKEAVQHAKGQRRYSEEVHCGNGLTVILEEDQPAFGEIRSSGTSPNPSRDTPFREIEAELEQFAVNTRRSPGRILGTIRKIKARISLLTGFRPPRCLALKSHFQYSRKPARCQLVTVLGVTRMRGFLQPDHTFLNMTQKSLCRAVSRRCGRLACRANSCCRIARFSRMRFSREPTALKIKPRRCRSDTIMARILSEHPNSSCSPSD